MLRITASKHASAAIKYFEEALCKADYYSKGEPTLGQWHGYAAQRLDLEGVVKKEDFAKLCFNQKTDSTKLNPRTSKHRKVGYDFTFSASKSASIAYAITGDERIREAFEKSVHDTMKELERDVRTQTGQGKNKRHVVTGNFAYAAFTHKTSRPVGNAPDPHLHTHCFMMNTTWNEKKQRFQATELGSIKRDAPYYEASFDARFAKRITQLGYAIERRGLSWEIADIDRKLIDTFSRRTVEIEKAAAKEIAKHGFLTDKQKDKLGSRTRQQKQAGQSYDELRQEWLSRLSDEESDTILKAHLSQPNESIAISAEEALQLASEHCFERKSVMSEKRLIAEALKRSYGSVMPEEVKIVLKDKTEQGQFYRHSENEQDYVTTAQAVQDEKQMLRYVREGRGTHTPLNAHYTPKADYLNEEQKAAIEQALQSSDQVCIIAGGAGTGKTTLMREVRDGIVAGGKDLFGFAPSAAASRGVMREEGFAEADTLAQLLINPKMQAKVKDQVIWIDEAGMIGNKDMLKVLKIAQQQNARLLLTGDIKQHHSVKSGDALRIIQERGGIKVARVYAVQRQRHNPAYKKVVEMITEDKIEAAINKLDRMGGVVEIRDAKQRMKALVKDYMQAHAEKKTALVVSPVKKEGQLVTASIREQLKVEGHLGEQEQAMVRYKNLNLTEERKRNLRLYQERKEELILEFHQNAKGFSKGERWKVVELDQSTTEPSLKVQRLGDGQSAQLPMHYATRFSVYQKDQLKVAAGDRIRITKGGKTIGGGRINNGDIFTVQRMDEKGNLQLDNGRFLAKNFAHLTHGYVTTSHSSQGKTVDRVFIAQSELSRPAASKQQFYVSISRGREQAKVYTDSKITLEKSVMKDGKRMTASQIAKKQQAIAATKEYKRVTKSQQKSFSKEKSIRKHVSRKQRDIG